MALLFGGLLGLAFFFILRAWHLRKLNALLDRALSGRLKALSIQPGEASRFEHKLMRYVQLSLDKEAELRSERAYMRRFIQDISHQTKTPMASLRLYMELLEEEALSVKALALLKKAQKASNQIESLERELLTLSRLETGLLRLQPEESSVLELVEAAVEAFLERARQRGMSLKIEGNDTVAFFDFRWSLEALSNLIDNAIKYGPEHSCVRLSICALDSRVLIEVHDEGEALSEEEIQGMFRRYARNSKAIGEGIGLALAREIATQQKGSLSVTRKAGTSFCLFLPKAGPKPLPQEANPSEGQAPA